MNTDLVAEVDRTMKDDRLTEQGDAIVVAVSGGPDSVALLHVLFVLSKQYEWKLIVAHVNHQFRGSESDAEADHVRNLARHWGLPCEVGVIDVPAYISESSINAQTAAREKRYAFLHEVADAYGAQRIAFAHHADDQAETLLMRLIRGTGPSGLTGIPYRRREKKVELIRPFLRIYKSELVEHCLAHRLTYYQDSSNESRKYFRNQVRLDVIPMLRRYNDQLPEALNRLSEMMQAEDEFMEMQTKQAFAQMMNAEPACCRFQRSQFATLHLALQRRLIKLILNYLCSRMERLDFAWFERIRLTILRENTTNAVMELQEQLYLVMEYEEIRFQSFAPSSAPFHYQVDLAERGLRIPEAGVQLQVTVVNKDSLPDSSGMLPASEVCFDLDRLQLPLYMRSRQAGDRMEPHGLNGSKKVKDMFIDAKMPLSRRDRIPILVDAAGRVLWIAGFRRSKHAPVESDTKQVLYMKLMLE